MNLENHLLYIDVTNQCNLNCNFCMYKIERKSTPLNLELNYSSKKNISKIINDPTTERLILSGEGEPFNNLKAIIDILYLSGGNKRIQIITNGLWILSKKSDKIISQLNKLSILKKDKYQIRISCDSFHIKKIGESNYKKIIEKIINGIKDNEKIDICFRSIIEEKNEILKTFKNRFISKEYNVSFNNISNLETDIVLDNYIKLNIIFKNMINIDNVNGINTFDSYIDSLENIYNKPFTLGHLKKGANGMDITIKPNGDLFYYGAEIYPFFNISIDNINIKKLTQTIENNIILYSVYTKPFKNIVTCLKKYEPFEKLILSTNNPYWIIKKIHAFNKYKFEELIRCV